MTTILQALQENNFQRVEQLILAGLPTDEQDDHGNTLLHIATRKKQPLIIKRLLEAGCNPNSSCRTKQQKRSLPNQHNKIIAQLQYLGNRTPLHIACKTNQYNIAEMLLQHGADIDCQDEGHCTPLHWSATKGHFEIVKLLLDNKANPNAQDLASSTPLHEAVRKKYYKIIILLLEHGANYDIYDITGNTAAALANNIKELQGLFNFVNPCLGSLSCQ